MPTYSIEKASRGKEENLWFILACLLPSNPWWSEAILHGEKWALMIAGGWVERGKFAPFYYCSARPISFSASSKATSREGGVNHWTIASILCICVFVCVRTHTHVSDEVQFFLECISGVTHYEYKCTPTPGIPSPKRKCVMRWHALMMLLELLYHVPKQL